MMSLRGDKSDDSDALKCRGEGAGNMLLRQTWHAGRPMTTEGLLSMYLVMMVMRIAATNALAKTRTV